MKIHIQPGLKKPKPKSGDIRESKKHGRQIRVHSRIDGVMLYKRGKPVFEWVDLTAENLEANRLRHMKHLLEPRTDEL